MLPYKPYHNNHLQQQYGSLKITVVQVKILEIQIQLRILTFKFPYPVLWIHFYDLKKYNQLFTMKMCSDV